MQTAGIISQVRMGSTRLPGKVLLPVAGRPMLDYHVARLRTSGLPVALATTTLPADDVLAAYAAEHDLPCYRGSESDVLSRYYEANQQLGFDVVVRVTSDCPLLDGPTIGAAVARYLAEGNALAYRSNVVARTFPRGLDFEIFSADLLALAHRRATTAAEREHVTPYLRAQFAPAGPVLRRDELCPLGDYSAPRLTLDVPADFEVLRQLIGTYHAHELALPELLALLNAHPELLALNAEVVQKTA
ncbi:NTP transferase domain-containing protein [Hymenobacter sp. RP-2-7]|uniref:NTP transferase domain-containing protein n=1 Tax=Hymenobacter polaris TaxID=2682546 RepID=A0A7Y0ACM8_9BACT|nr:glycosyltransferase family protein [Hymenobacter polaris]NML64898.1 NTP transferase domain-containing protein [Hymenobacter polaris]